nr:hypothetical protein [Candidatus Sigynarchaeota archaeon]
MAANEFTLERGVVKSTRKPAKMGTDYIFWIPRAWSIANHKRLASDARPYL